MAQLILQRVLQRLRPGAIVLMHVASFSSDHAALAVLIHSLRGRGYRFATLSALEPPAHHP